MPIGNRSTSNSQWSTAVSVDRGAGGSTLTWILLKTSSSGATRCPFQGRCIVPDRGRPSSSSRAEETDPALILHLHGSVPLTDFFPLIESPAGAYDRGSIEKRGQADYEQGSLTRIPIDH